MRLQIKHKQRPEKNNEYNEWGGKISVGIIEDFTEEET